MALSSLAENRCQGCAWGEEAGRRVLLGWWQSWALCTMLQRASGVLQLGDRATKQCQVHQGWSNLPAGLPWVFPWPEIIKLLRLCYDQPSLTCSYWTYLQDCRDKSSVLRNSPWEDQGICKERKDNLKEILARQKNSWDRIILYVKLWNLYIYRETPRIRSRLLIVRSPRVVYFVKWDWIKWKQSHFLIW